MARHGLRAAVSARRNADLLLVARTDVRAAIDVPMLVNATEFDKGEPLTVAAMAELGANMIIFPVSLLRLAMYVAERGLATLRDEGGLKSLLGEIRSRGEMYELLDYGSFQAFDDSVFNFRLPTWPL